MTHLAPFESSIAERYHEETKYSEEGLRREAERQLPPDWTAPPIPFKQYDGPRILLPSDGLPIERRGGDPPISGPPTQDGSLDLARLSRILWHTNGCTRIVGVQGGGVHHFRAAPSAGGMYPTEVYVTIRDVAGVPSGIYDYQLLDHSLALVREADPTEALRAALFGHPAATSSPAAIVLTGVWKRGSFRYRERAYRRALLDTGHVLGNLTLAATDAGLTAFPVASFRDELVESLLGIDPVVEGPLVVAPLVPPEVAAGLSRVPPRCSDTVEWRHAVAQVGERVPEGSPDRLIAAVHLAGRLDADAAPVAAAAAPPSRPSPDSLRVHADAPATSWTRSEPVTDTIAARRSTRRFRREPLPRDALLSTLAFGAEAPTDALFVSELLRTYVVVLDVVGIPPGSYFYETTDAHHLVELSRGGLAREMLHLGLGQEIFANAGAVVVHTVDLTRAVQRYGDRVYRLLGLDAGHIGERLNLAALREGFGASGCGGYFDDEMNRALAIPESQAVIYITSLGTPDWSE